MRKRRTFVSRMLALLLAAAMIVTGAPVTTLAAVQEETGFLNDLILDEDEGMYDEDEEATPSNASSSDADRASASDADEATLSDADEALSEEAREFIRRVNALDREKILRLAGEYIEAVRYQSAVGDDENASDEEWERARALVLEKEEAFGREWEPALSIESELYDPLSEAEKEADEVKSAYRSYRAIMDAVQNQLNRMYENATAALSVKEINLDSTVLRPASTWKSTDGHKLYFGRYNRRPTLFRVLPQSPDTMSTDVDALFLDCNKALKTMAWSSGTTIWSDSACSIRNWLNGDMYYKSSSVFTEKERAAIAETALKSLSDYTGYDPGNVSYTDDASTEKIFLLSHWEIWNIYMDRSFEGTVPNPDDVWLRTRINARTPEFISYIMSGQPVIYPPTWTEGGVSPAFNLDLSKVLFTSPATTYKTSKTGLTPVGTTGNKTWKTTLLDSERKFTVTESPKVSSAGGVVGFGYTGAKTGDNEYISAILTNSSNEVLYYGKIKKPTAENGGATVEIPSGIEVGTYTLKVFNEQINEDKVTDYASAFSDVTLTVVSTDVAPNFPGQPLDQTVTVEDTATFEVGVEGSPIPTYQWQVSTDGGNGWTNIDGATDVSYTTEATTISMSGYQYRCVAKNSAVTEGVPSAPATLTVNRKTGSGSVTMEGWTYGETAKEPVPESETNGTDHVTYEYKVKDADDSTYAATKPSDAGSYTVRATFAATEIYNKCTAPPADFTIAPKELTVTNTEIATREYDGTTGASFLNPPELDGVVDDDDVTLTYGTPSFTDGNVGVDKEVTLTADFEIEGAAAGNYTLTQPSGLKGTITKRSITVVAGTYKVSKPYDGTTAPGTASGALSVTRILTADSAVKIVPGTIPAYTNANVGTYTLALPISISGDTNGNYKIANNATSVNVSAEITAVDGAVTNISNLSKTYDGTAVGKPTFTSKSTATATVEYKKSTETDDAYTTTAPKTVGDYIVRVTVPTDGNYAQASNTAEFTIEQREVTITGVTVADSKVYNGNVYATIDINSGTIPEKINGDELTIQYGSAEYSDETVGNGKTVTFDGFGLGGAAKDNYTLTAQPASVMADITERPLAVSGTTIKTKTYDGKTTAEIDNKGELVGAVDTALGVISGDDVELVAGTVVFADKKAGTNRPVNVKAGEDFKFKLIGDDAGNYTLAQPEGLTGTIEQRTLTVSGTTIRTKPYDGNTDAEVENAGTLGGVQSDDDGNLDDVTLVAGTVVFADKKAGTNRPVNVKAGEDFKFKLIGDDAGNYTLAQPEGLTGTIEQRTLTVSGTKIRTKTYDGNTTAELEAAGTLDDVQSDDDGNRDDVTLVPGTVTFADKNAGTKSVSVTTDFTLDGADKDNYTLTQPSGLTGTITKKVLSGVTWGTTTFTYDGTAKKPGATVTAANGLVGSDICAVTVTGEKKNAGTYTATASALGNANYELPSERPTTEFTIEKREPTYTAPAGKENLTYNGTAQALLKSVGSVDEWTGGVPESMGTMWYRVSYKAPTAADYADKLDWTKDTAALTAADAGEYKIEYYIKGNPGTDGGTAVLNYSDAGSEDHPEGSVTVTIAQKALSDDMITITGGGEGHETQFEYTGSPITPTVTVSDKAGDEEIITEDDWKYTADSHNTKTDFGAYTVKIEAKPSGNYTGSAQSSWQITKKPIAVAITVPSDWTYGDNETSEEKKAQITAESNPGGATPIYTYYTNEDLADEHKTDATEAGGEASEPGGIPKNAGTYWVKADVPETKNYSANSGHVSFTIAKRPVTATVTDKSKVYGEADPAWGYTTEPEALPYGDILELSLDRGDKDSETGKDVGDHTITLTEVTPSDINKNFDLTLNDGRLTITQRPVSVTYTGSDFTYNTVDQRPAAALGAVTGNDASGVVPGDDINVKVIASGDGVTGEGDAAESIDTGSYTASVKLTGTKAGNYALMADTDKPLTKAYEIMKYTPVIETAPAAVAGLTYNGSEQNIITLGALETLGAGHETEGDIYYRVTYHKPGGTEFTETIQVWSKDITALQGKAAGSYKVDYYVKGAVKTVGSDTIYNYEDLGSADAPHDSVTVTIAQKALTNDMITITGGGEGHETQFEYTGSPITPTVTVSDKTGEVENITADDWGYTDDSHNTKTDFGAYTVKIEAKPSGNYAGSAQSSWNITKKPITVAITVPSDWTYGDNETSEEKKAQITAESNPGGATPIYTYYTNEDLADAHKTDATEAGGEASEPGGIPKNAGTYWVKADVPQTQNYSANSGHISFTIAKRPVTATVTDKSKVYGEADPAWGYTTEPEALPYDEKLDAAITRATGETVGDYTLTLTADADTSVNKNYTITPVTGKFTITQRPVSVTYTGDSFVYNTADQRPTAALGEVTGPTASGVVPGDDIDVKVIATGDGVTGEGDAAESIDTGSYTASVKLTGTKAGNYALMADTDKPLTKAYEIMKYIPVIETAPAAVAGLTYNGSEQNIITLGALETLGAGHETEGDIYYRVTYHKPGGTEFTETIQVWSKDITALQGKAAGSYKVDYYVKGAVKTVGSDTIYNYEDLGSADAPHDSVTVTIAQKALTNDMITITGGGEGHETQFEYTGSVITPTVTVSDKAGDEEIITEDDWEYTDDSHNSKTDFGAYTVKIEAKPSGNYAGSAQSSWNITKKPIAVAITVPSDWTYGDNETSEEKKAQITAASNPGGATPIYTYYTNEDLADAHKTDATEAGGEASEPGGIPKNAGTYWVKADVPETKNYSANSGHVSFTIAKRPVTATVTDKSKVYGEADPAWGYTTEPEALPYGDILELSLTRGDKDSETGKDVGVHTITVTEVTPSDVNKNFDLTLNDGRLTITQRPVSVTYTGFDFTYNTADQRPAAALGEVTGQTASGVVPGDDIDVKVIATGDGVTGEGDAAESIDTGSYTAGAKLTGDETGNYVLTADTDKPLTKTYTIAKYTPVITTAPAAVAGLIFNGANQKLITDGALEELGSINEKEGTLRYRVLHKGPADSGFARTVDWTDDTSALKGLNAGEYKVEYYVEGAVKNGAIHNYKDLGSVNSPHGTVEVAVDKKPLGEGTEAAAGITVTLTLGSYVFDRQDKTPEVTVVHTYAGGAEITLTRDTEYEASGDLTKSAAGTYQITVSAKENTNYTGSVQRRWQIGRSTGSVEFEENSLSWVYGEDTSPKVTAASRPESPDSDVTYTYYKDEELTVKTTPEADRASEIGALPKNAGTYWVKADVPATSNYNACSGNHSFTISPKEVVIEWSDTEFTYNHTNRKPTATVTNKVSWNDVEDVVDVLVTGEQMNANQDAAPTYTATADDLTGTHKDNYKLPDEKPTITFTIARKEVTIIGAEVEPTKTYDGTAAATITDEGSLSDNYDGENLRISRGTASYDDKNVGAGKRVTFTGYELAGSAKDNYTLTGQPASTTAAITPLTLTVTGTDIKTKTYDGSKKADFSGTPAFEGIVTVGGVTDEVIIRNAKVEFEDRNAGDNKRVIMVAEFDKSGRDAGNYTIEQPVDLTGSIKKKRLTVKLTVKDKYYDGTRDAEYVVTPELDDSKVEGDTVDLTNGTPTFADAAVGENKAINFTPFSISGDDESNYTLTQPTGITATIKPYTAVKGTDYTTNAKGGWQNEPLVVSGKNGCMVAESEEGPWLSEITRSENTPLAGSAVTFYVKKQQPDQMNDAISSAVTVTYKLDRTDPTAEASLAGGSSADTWNTFNASPTFGAYLFRNGRTLNVTAVDGLSGIKETSWLRVSAADVPPAPLNEAQLKEKTGWESFENASGGTIQTTASTDGEYAVYYIRMTDNAGNTSYISTAGFTIDTVAPTIAGAGNGKTYYTTRTLTVKDKNLASVKVNGTAIGDPYTLTGDTNAAYNVVAADEVGNTATLSVTMKPIASLMPRTGSVEVSNVKAPDRETIESERRKITEVLDEIQSDPKKATSSERTTLEKAAGKAADLIRRIDETESRIRLAEQTLKKYSIEQVKSSDEAALSDIYRVITSLTGGDNLTGPQRRSMEDLESKAAAMLARIREVREKREALLSERTGVNSYSTSVVNGAHRDEIRDLAAVAEELLATSNLTRAERKSVKAGLERAEKLLADIRAVVETTLPRAIRSMGATEDTTEADVTAVIEQVFAGTGIRVEIGEYERKKAKILGVSAMLETTLTLHYGESPETGETVVRAYLKWKNSGKSDPIEPDGGWHISEKAGVDSTSRITADKGRVDSKLGIVTTDDSYTVHSRWEATELTGDGKTDTRWRLRYANGTYAAGSMEPDENGVMRENLAWELVNGNWWAFGADSYVVTGWVYDRNYNGWFYIDEKRGAMLGWNLIDGKWYYFEPERGKNQGRRKENDFVDGYYLGSDGSWDGKEKKDND